MFYLLLDTVFTLLGPMNYYAIFVLSLLNIANVVGIPSAAVFALAFVYVLAFIFGVLLIMPLIVLFRSLCLLETIPVDRHSFTRSFLGSGWL